MSFNIIYKLFVDFFKFEPYQQKNLEFAPVVTLDQFHLKVSLTSRRILIKLAKRVKKNFEFQKLILNF